MPLPDLRLVEREAESFSNVPAFPAPNPFYAKAGINDWGREKWDRPHPT
jgi:hypothetical protein